MSFATPPFRSDRLCNDASLDNIGSQGLNFSSRSDSAVTFMVQIASWSQEANCWETTYHVEGVRIAESGCLSPQPSEKPRAGGQEVGVGPQWWRQQDFIPTQCSSPYLYCKGFKLQNLCTAINALVLWAASVGTPVNRSSAVQVSSLNLYSASCSLPVKQHRNKCDV